MATNQTKLLLDLASEIKKKHQSREEIIASLYSAKIFTRKGNFTKHYAHLGKAITAVTK